MPAQAEPNEGLMMQYSLIAWFLGVIASNLALSIFAFAAAFYARRQQYPVTWSRGGMVFITVWPVVSVIVFLAHMGVYLATGLVIPEDRSVEDVLRIVILGVLFVSMYFALADVSRPKSPSAKE